MFLIIKSKMLVNLKYKLQVNSGVQKGILCHPYVVVSAVAQKCTVVKLMMIHFNEAV